jgi:outer membrane protein TolC
MTRALIVIASMCVWSASTRAQETVSDTLNLADLQNAAVQNDPRGKTIPLLAEQSNLRMQNLRAERLPSLAVNGQAQYQSTTFKLPIQLPGITFPTPYRDTYDAHLDAREQVFDPTIGARRNLERAQLAESQARVNTALYTLRQNVNDAYFTALVLQERNALERTSLTDLESQLKVARLRVREGTALPSEAATIEATLLSRRQAVDELDANRKAALNVLADLTGRPVNETAVLAIPAQTSNAVIARGAIDSLRSRPEFKQFESARNVVEAQRSVAARREMPRISAFGRAGYGRPGLNPLSREFDNYWITGLQLNWSPFSWGTGSRDRQVLALQSQIVSAEEAAFRQALVRSVENDLAAIERLDRTIAADDTIIALRENVLRETRARYAEAVITSAEYVDRQTDLLAAQLARATHRVELAQARAHFFTTIGAGAQ